MLNISNAEIRYNLEILQNTLIKINDPNYDSNVKYKNGEAIEIDYEFVNIFNAAIEENKQTKEFQAEIGSLEDELRQISSQVKDVAGQVFVWDGERNTTHQLMGKKSSLADLASRHKEHSFLQIGYNKLASTYEYYPIRGEGHCLFRSIAAGFMMNVSKMSDTQYNKLNKHLEQVKEAYKSRRLIKKDDFSFLESIITQVRKTKDWEKVIRHPETSQRLVEFLRRLSCTFNETIDKDSMTAILVEANLEFKDEYFSKMISMDEAAFGGDAELVALSKCLKSTLHKLHIEPIGQDANPEEESNFVYPNGESLGTISLLYKRSPGHYDLGIPK